MQFLGKATIKVAGNTLNSMAGAKLNLGGSEREPVMGATKMLGYSSKPVAGMVECEVALAKGQSLKSLDFEDATVTFIADTGQVWSGANAFLSNPLELTAEGGGKVSLKIICEKFEEVTA